MSSATMSPEVVVTEQPTPVVAVRAEPSQLKPRIVEINPGKTMTNDPRVDLLSLWNIAKPRMEKLSVALKADMKREGTKFATGAFGTAELRASGTPEVIDPMAFYKLCKQRGHDDEAIMGCITVTKGKAEDLLSKGDIAKICNPGKAKDASLFCAIPKGDEVPSIAKAMMQLSTLIAKSKEEPPATLKITDDNGDGEGDID